MFSWIPGLSSLKRWAVEVGGVLLALLAALVYGWAKGAKAGEAEVESKDAKEIQKALQVKSKVEQSVGKLPEDAAKKELDKKWSRD